LLTAQANAETANGHTGDQHEADEDETTPRGGSLSWLMSRMSFVARHIIVHRPPLNSFTMSSVSKSFHRTGESRAYDKDTLERTAHVHLPLLCRGHGTSRCQASSDFPLARVEPDPSSLGRCRRPRGGRQSADWSVASEFRSKVLADDSDDLKQLATEVRDFVQNKVGTTEFSKVWEGMRRKVSERREERRDAKNRLVRFACVWCRV
jgi:U3 small nucleolar RNA-associated protein 20